MSSIVFLSNSKFLKPFFHFNLSFAYESAAFYDIIKVIGKKFQKSKTTLKLIIDFWTFLDNILKYFVWLDELSEEISPR